MSIDSNECNFCQHDFHSDKKNSRGKDGIHCKQKNWTKRAIDLKHTCPFYCYIANRQLKSKNGNLFESRLQISNENEKLVANMGRGKLPAIQI